jgi:crotonobetainyl-CoA:carnitine CoA-transferase CaiB-like acyl-CoA transferase
VSGGGGLVVYPCKDGYFVYNIFGGELGARSNRQLVAWMDSENKAPDFLKKKDWEKFDMETATMEDLDAIATALKQFFETHTKKELYEGALQRKIMGQPVNTL